MVVAWGTGGGKGGGVILAYCFCSLLWKCVYLPVSVGHNGSEVKNKQTKKQKHDYMYVANSHPGIFRLSCAYFSPYFHAVVDSS